MQIDAADRRNDEHEKKEEEQRNRRQVTDLARQWAGLQLLRHEHADLISRHQVLVIPIQIPALVFWNLTGRGARVFGKVNVFEIRLYGEAEVAELLDIAAETITPGI